MKRESAARADIILIMNTPNLPSQNPFNRSVAKAESQIKKARSGHPCKSKSRAKKLHFYHARTGFAQGLGIVDKYRVRLNRSHRRREKTPSPNPLPKGRGFSRRDPFNQVRGLFWRPFSPRGEGQSLHPRRRMMRRDLRTIQSDLVFPSWPGLAISAHIEAHTVPDMPQASSEPPALLKDEAVPQAAASW
jgi:hypothetical protein